MLSIGFWQHEHQYDQNVEEYDHIDMPCCLKTLLSFNFWDDFLQGKQKQLVDASDIAFRSPMQSPIGVGYVVLGFDQLASEARSEPVGQDILMSPSSCG